MSKYQPGEKVRIIKNANLSPVIEDCLNELETDRVVTIKEFVGWQCRVSIRGEGPNEERYMLEELSTDFLESQFRKLEENKISRFNMMDME